MQPPVPLVPWHAHATTVLVIHMIWSTRNRAPWLDPRLDAWLAALLERKARALDCLLIAAGNADDHVHVVVRHPPRISVAQIAHRLNGASSRSLHLTLPHNVWQVGYWAESVTPSALEPLVAYVRGQRAHHAVHSCHESWESNRA